MIPEDKHTNKNLTTPKRFDIGYYSRETLDLFASGWRVASRHLKESQRLEEAREDRKHIAELLERALYDGVSRGTPEQQLEALKYLQRKKASEAHQGNRPYTWGEQISSLAFNAAYLTVCLTVIAFVSTWACGSSESQGCKDVRSLSRGIVQYWTVPKN
jgi:hypothetical protein